ncbi:MAG TPA: MFS transporter [Anaeromyxobacteraceae bacterium]|nr:MFS transporter [Anaeromyxobacteraceae bacterium]
MRSRSALGVLFVVVFVDLLGFGMVIPTMPTYAADMHAPKAWIGLLMTGYSAMQFLFAPVWGRVSDRVGRRKVFLVSIAMTAVAFFAYALAPTWGWLLAARLFAGFATANLAIARAFVADVTTPETRARGMGIIGASFGLGFILGPFFGGVLSHHVSHAAPAWVAGLLAAVNGVAAYFILPEPETHVAAERRPRFAALRGEMKVVGIRRVLIVSFLSILAFSAMEATFALIAKDSYGLDQAHIGYVFAYIGVFAVLVQGGLIGPLTRRFGERRLLVAGLVMQGASFLVLPFAGSLAGLLGVLVPLSLGSGLTSPSLSALLSRMAHKDEQGGTMGIGESASALGRIVGPETGTFTYANVGHAFPYLLGGVLMAVAAGFAVSLAGARTEPDASTPARGA